MRVSSFRVELFSKYTKVASKLCYTMLSGLKWARSIGSFCLCDVSLSLLPILYFKKSTRENQ